MPTSANEVHLLDSVSFQSLEILYCAKFDIQSKKWNLSPHSHDHLEIIYFIDGGARILSNDQMLEVTAGDVVLYPENTDHQEILDMSSNQMIVVVGVHLQKYSDLPGILKVSDSDERLHWLFLEMFRNTQETLIGQQRIMAHLLHLVLFYFSQELRKNLKDGEGSVDSVSSINCIVHYINMNYGSNIRIDDLLKLAEVSRSYFNRSFKKSIGQTPIEYLNHVRMEAAKHLLVSNPSLNVATVGERVGVNNEKYFSRLFKDHSGVTPTEFKRNSGLVK